MASLSIRRHLQLPVVLWSVFAHRNERSVWRPHLRLATRQAFRDGVSAAERLLAVKQRLNQAEMGSSGQLASGRGRWLVSRMAYGAVERFRQRKGLLVARAICGDPQPILSVLRRPPGEWRQGADLADTGLAGIALTGTGLIGTGLTGTGLIGTGLTGDEPPPGEPVTGWFPVTRDRVRWLPWQARTVSWQAAYNIACLYAVLARQGLCGEEQVVASLRRVASNRDSELERPHDWISNDPEFTPLLRRGTGSGGAPFPKLRAFLTAQERRDYPVRQTSHEPPAMQPRAPA